MTYNIIGTGSSGNAVVIDGCILIDCGVPFKSLAPVIDGIKLVLLTHAHKDHFKPSTAAAIHRRHPAIRFGCCEWMVGHLLDAGVSKRMIDLYDLGTGHFYGPRFPYSIEPEKLTHNVPNCGYRIFGPDWKSLFYATDTGTLDGITAKDYDLYLIEANHTQAEIEERAAAKQAAGEYAYEVEAAKNHLSQEQALDWIYQNIGTRGQYVFLHGHTEREEAPANGGEP
jgi:L-ascorbate metabolism protein UlaG (beta-lactamase superfamily)